MDQPLGVGVVGLGRRWRYGYKPALQALPRHFSVRAVCDQLLHRAQREARQLGCVASAGPAELCEQAGVEVILLLDRQWFGLWPLELASRARKPVLCAPPLESDEAHAERLLEMVETAGDPVLAEMPLRLAPVTAVVGQLLNDELGRPRLITGDVYGSSRSRRGSSALRGLPGLGLGTHVLDWCISWLQEDLVEHSLQMADAVGLAHLQFVFAEGRALSLRACRGQCRATRVRIGIEAERGQAQIELPRRISWSSPQGWHRLELARARPISRVLLEHFYQVVRQGKPVEWPLRQALHALRLLRLAASTP
jgi:predicted dehydrogenase